jgi:hypothetical protein
MSVWLVANSESVDLRLLPMLEAVDPAVLDGETRVDLLRAWERVSGSVEGAKRTWCIGCPRPWPS